MSLELDGQPCGAGGHLLGAEEALQVTIRPICRIFKRGVLIAATGDLQCGGLGAQPPDADESSISCYLSVA